MGLLEVIDTDLDKTLHKYQMLWLKRGFVLKGYLAEVASLSITELLNNKEKIESLMCAHVAMSLPLEVADLPDEMQMQIGAWREAREAEMVDMYDRIEALKSSMMNEIVTRLKNATAAMQPLAKGGENRQSWKEGLPDEPAMHEVFKAGKVITAGELAKKVAAAYKDLKKDCCEERSKASSAEKMKTW